MQKLKLDLSPGQKPSFGGLRFLRLIRWRLSVVDSCNFVWDEAYWLISLPLQATLILCFISQYFIWYLARDYFTWRQGYFVFYMEIISLRCWSVTNRWILWFWPNKGLGLGGRVPACTWPGEPWDRKPPVYMFLVPECLQVLPVCTLATINILLIVKECSRQVRQRNENDRWIQANESHPLASRIIRKILYQTRIPAPFPAQFNV